MALALLLVGLGGFAGKKAMDYRRNVAKQGSVATNYATSASPLNDLANQSANGLSVVTDSSARLTVNGTLNINGSLIINQSGKPAKPTKGQIYYSKTDNKLWFYDGIRYIDITYASSAPTSVSSVQGQTGAVTFTGGRGISVTGTTISSTLPTGVQSLLAGSANISITSDGNGGYTITDANGGVGVELQNSTPGSPQTGNINITGTMIAGSFEGDGSGLTNLNASNVASGTLDDARLSTNVTLAGNTFNGVNQLVQLDGSGFLPALNGSALTDLNASNIATGTLADARLSANVTLQGNIFNGANQLVKLNPSGDLPALSGINLTNLNASAVTAGTLPDARLSANVTLMGNTFNGANQLLQLTNLGYLPAVNGSNVTALNASNISSGTLADARLSANVALLNGNQTFSGSNTFSSAINANTITPSAALTVGATGQSFTLQGNGSSTITSTTGGFTATIGFAGVPIGNVAYNFDNSVTAGTYTICTTYGNCAGTGGGVTTPGGTTNKLARFTGAQTIGDSAITDTGAIVTIQNSSDSINGFQIQNSAGTSNLFIADTTNTRIGIGMTSPAYTLDVNGDINSATGLRVAGNLVCDSSGCIAGGGSGFYIQNSTALQTAANFNIESTSPSAAAGVVRGTTGQTADIFQVWQGATLTGRFMPSGDLSISGNYLISGSQISSSNLSDYSNIAHLNGIQTFSANNTFTGQVLLQNSVDSTIALRVQNSAGTSNLLVADTTNTRIGIGTATPGYMLDVNGDINIPTGAAFRINGVAICGVAPTCAPSSGSSYYIQNSTALQTNANFNIVSANSASVGGIIRGASGQTADLFRLQDETGANVATFNNNGRLVLGQNAAATGTLNFRHVTDIGDITLVPSSPGVGSYTLALPAENGTLCSTGSVCAGYASSSGSGNYIQNGTAIQTSANFAIQSAAAGSIGAVIRGAASQTANLQEWQDSAGTVLASISSAGNLTIGSSAATTGDIRLANAVAITWRNAANTADIAAITVTSGNSISIGSNNQTGLVLGAAGGGTGYTQIQAASGVLFKAGGTEFARWNYVSGLFEINSSSAAGTVEKFRVNSPTTVDNAANVVFAASAAGSKPLVIQGAASQTANLQEWQSSAGTVLNRIASTGAMQLGFNIALQGEHSSNGTFVDLIKRGPSNNVWVGNSTSDTEINTANNMLFDVAGTQKMALTASALAPAASSGLLFGTPSLPWSTGYFKPSGSSVKGLVVTAAASQTADLQQWQNSSGTVLSSVNANGLFNIGTASDLIAANAKAYISGTTIHATTATADNWTLNGVTRGTQFFTSETAANGSPASMSVSGSGYSGGTIGTLGTFGFIGSFSGASGSGSRTIIGALNEARSSGGISGDTLFGTRSTASFDLDASAGSGNAYALYGSASTNTASGGSGRTAYGVYGVGNGGGTNTTVYGGYFTTTGANSTNVALQATTGNLGAKGLVIKGVTSQSASLQEWQDNSGTVLGSVSAAGILSAAAGSFGTTPAVAGTVRLPNAGTITARNAANSADITLLSTSSNVIVLGGANQSGLQVGTPGGGTGTTSIMGATSVTITKGASSTWIGAAPTTTDALADTIFGTTATTQKGIVIQGKASQTANLQEWQDSTGAILAYASNVGRIKVASGGSGGLLVGTTSGLTTSADGGNLNINNSSAGQYIFINPSATGNIYLGSTTDTATIEARRQINISSAADAVKLQIQGAATQTANLQEWQSNAGTVLTSVSGTGNLTFGASASSSTGVIRLQNATSIGWRNAANTGDKFITLDSSKVTDGLNLPGNVIVGGSDNTGGALYFFSTSVGVKRGAASSLSLVAGGTALDINQFGKVAIAPSANWLAGIDTGGTVEKLRVSSPVTVDNLANTILTASAATSKPLVVQGFTSQSANLQEWQTSAGTIVNRIASTGAMQLGFNIALQGEYSSGGSFVDLIKRGSGNSVFVGSTSGADTFLQGINLVSIGNGNGSFVWSATTLRPSITRTGNFGSASYLWSDAYFGSSSSGAVALHVVGNTSQTGNLQQWENVSNTVLLSVTAAGAIQGGPSGGAVTINGGTAGASTAGGAITLQAADGGATSGAGGAVTINTGAGGGGNSAGGAFTLQTGAGGTGNAAGGAISILSGAGGTTFGNGGAINITAGNGTATNTNGGAIAITAGTSVGNQAGGALTITAGGAAGAAGGTLTLKGGNSTGNSGGGVVIQGGTTASGIGGGITLTAANGVGNAGGAISLTTGSATSVNIGGGALSLTTGAGSGNAAGGAISLQAGAGGAGSSTGAAVSITAGTGGTTSGTGGAVTILSGNAVSGTAGNVTIDVGTSTSSNGAILIGNATRSQSIIIGNVTGATSVSLQAGSGNLNLGNAAVSNTIILGATSSNVTQTINIGNNAGGTSSTNVTIGSGIGSGSISIQNGTGGLLLGTTNGVAQTIQIGANSNSAQTIRVGASTGGSSAVTAEIGSPNGTSSLKLSAGTGGINLGNDGAANTIQIGNASSVSAQTINIGTNAGGSPTTTVNIGSLLGASVTNIRAGTGLVNVSTTGADATTVAQFTNAGATTCTVQPGGTGFACSSDARLKTNVVTVVNPLDIVRQLRGVTFNWTSDPNGQTHSGFIAQELEQLIPSAVSTDSNGYKVANYTEIIPYPAGTAQAQDLQITGIEQAQTALQQTQTDTTDTLTTVDGRVQTLEQKVAALEAAQPQGSGNSFNSLNVSGTATIQNLAVTGSATIATLTVTGDATFAGNILVNGHIIGNADTRGTVTVPATQISVKHTFTKPYEPGTEPNVVLTAKNGFAPSYRVESDETSFTVFFQTPVAADMVMNYQVQQ